MKTTTSLIIAAATGLLAAEPNAIRLIPSEINTNLSRDPEPNAPARMAVMTQIVARLEPKMPPFSRMMPVHPYPTFRAVELVGAEERLPFTVQMLGKKDQVSGYVRIADNAIFIYRPETKDHIRSTLDPRFAPPKQIRIEPEKQA